MGNRDYLMETKNLFIRESDIADCQYFMDFESDSQIHEHFSMNSNRSLDDVKKDFLSLQEGLEGPVLLFTLVDKKKKKPIGRFIAPIDKKRNHIHIDWLYIGDGNMRNRGYGTEALKAFLDYSFCVLKLERVGIDFFSTNDRVEALYERHGFVREGILRHYTKKDNEYIDLVYMSILRDEYFARGF